MSPNLITEHDKILKWPEVNDLAPGHFLWLPEFKTPNGDLFQALLEDDGSNMAHLHIKEILSAEHIASYVLTFDLTPPVDLGQRLPQVESAYVSQEYQGGGVSTATYKAIIDHYGAVISDTYQTEGGMVLWLFGLSKDDSIQLTILNVDGHTLDYKINEHGESISFQGDRKSLLEIADTVWGNPDNVELSNLETLGFTPSWRNHNNHVLAATKSII
ncbi:Uncharacterised protein [Yersinia enterocolitica]|nr:Uncharacterised protein [Yersinia enterocolitica]